MRYRNRFSKLNFDIVESIGSEEKNKVETLSSWTIPDLAFADLSKYKEQAKEQDLLELIYRSRSDFAIAIFGDGTDYLGFHTPAEFSLGEIESLQRLKESVERDASKSITVSRIQEKLVDLTGYCGLLSRLPQGQSSKRFFEIGSESEATMFGFLILGIPIPQLKLHQMENLISDQLDRLNGVVDPYTLLMKTELDAVKLGITVGHWLTAVYFFAPDLENFNKLKSQLRNSFSEQNSEFVVEPRNDLEEHIHNFGVLKNKSDSFMPHHFDYKYLNSLNSIALASLI